MVLEFQPGLVLGTLILIIFIPVKLLTSLMVKKINKKIM